MGGMACASVATPDTPPRPGRRARKKMTVLGANAAFRAAGANRRVG
jgi:hypothetical protein